MKSVLYALLAFTLAGCAGGGLVTKRPAVDPNTGEIYLYLEPLPQDAARLGVSLSGISAVKADGQEVPLTLKIQNLKATGTPGQRLMARGVLPPGEYAGLSCKVEKAHLRNEEGDSALLLPEKPSRNGFGFSVRSREATVVSLSLRTRESLRGIRFDPVFAMSVPESPLPALTGYVSNEAADSVTVFDKRSARVARVIRTGRAPAGLALDQIQKKAYVAVSGDDAVEVIDTNQNRIISRIPLHPGDAPREIALTPDGRMLIVANVGSNTVSFIDPLSLTETGRVNVGDRPLSLLMDRVGRKAYVFNNLSNTISVIDVSKRAVTATIPTESGPLRGQLNRKGDRLVVSHSMSPYLVAIDTTTFAMTKRVYAGMGISAVKVNPSTDFVYLGYRTGGKIDIFDSYSYIAGDFIPSAEGIASMTIDGDENNLVILHPASGTVQLVNLVSKKEVALVDVGEESGWVALYGER